MKALILARPGQPETLKLTEHPIPVPLPNEVRVKVAAVRLKPVARGL